MPNINLLEADVRDVIHFFFLLDNSGSMAGRAIQALNEAMVNAMRELEKEAYRKEVKAIMHILSFNSSIQWLCGTTAEKGVPVEEIEWNDISAHNTTDTAWAIRSILPGLSRSLLGHHAYRPIIVLITDGYSNDRAETKTAIQELRHRQKTINIVVGARGYSALELEDFASEGAIQYCKNGQEKVVTANGKFIFPVDDEEKLSGIIGDIAVSSLKASIFGKLDDPWETILRFHDTDDEVDWEDADDESGWNWIE